jgi:hypothetical protein
MVVRLDDNFFSKSSSASRILAQAFKTAQQDGITNRTIEHFNRYTEALAEITKTDMPVREKLFTLWHESELKNARVKLKPLFDKFELPFDEYENILIHRLRLARSHGVVMEKMRS